MSLETGNYITDLVPTNPTGTDPKSQGDDQIRLVKKCTQQSFPSIAGPVNLTDVQLNALLDASLTEDGYQKLPSGLIVQWGVASGTGARGVTFPIAFPTAAFMMIASVKSASNTVNEGYQCSANIDSLAGATVVAKFDNLASISLAAEDVYWLAVGH